MLFAEEVKPDCVLRMNMHGCSKNFGLLFAVRYVRYGQKCIPLTNKAIKKRLENSQKIRSCETMRVPKFIVNGVTVAKLLRNSYKSNSQNKF